MLAKSPVSQGTIQAADLLAHPTANPVAEPIALMVLVIMLTVPARFVGTDQKPIQLTRDLIVKLRADAVEVGTPGAKRRGDLYSHHR